MLMGLDTPPDLVSKRSTRSKTPPRPTASAPQPQDQHPPAHGQGGGRRPHVGPPGRWGEPHFGENALPRLAVGNIVGAGCSVEPGMAGPVGTTRIASPRLLAFGWHLGDKHSSLSLSPPCSHARDWTWSPHMDQDHPKRAAEEPSLLK